MKTWLALGFVALLAASIAVPVLWLRWAGADEGNAAPLWSCVEPFDDWARQRLMAEYEAAKQEIQLRIEFQNNLALARFGVCGAVLGFMLSSSLREVLARWLGLALPRNLRVRGGPSRGVRARFDGAYVVVGLWLASLVSAILDLQLGFNDLMIATLGHWVRTRFENCGGVIPGWEGHFANLNHYPWSYARLAPYGMTVVLLGAAHFATWFALRRRIHQSQPMRLELCISALGALAISLTLTYGTWILMCYPE